MENENTLIGMIVPTTDNPFFSGLISHAERILSEKHIGLLVMSSANNAEKEKENFRRLIKAGVSGILCVSGLSALPDDILNAVQPIDHLSTVQTLEQPTVQTLEQPTVQTLEQPTVQTLEQPAVQTLEQPAVQTSVQPVGLQSDSPQPSVPLVFIDRKPETSRSIPSVANDDASAMEEAAEYLISKGCKNILLLPGFLAEQQQNPRVTGYKKALASHGIPFREEYILKRSGRRSTEEETEEMVQKILHDDLPIDGILASSDRSAFGAMAALRSVGLYVPEDVKLICFDNTPYAAMTTPALTTLDRNPADLASKACDLLLNFPQGAPDVIVPVSLIPRDSTR